MRGTFASRLLMRKREDRVLKKKKIIIKKNKPGEKVESWQRTDSECLARRHSLNLKLFEHNEDVPIINICSVNRFAGKGERKTPR